MIVLIVLIIILVATVVGCIYIGYKTQESVDLFMSGAMTGATIVLIFLIIRIIILASTSEIKPTALDVYQGKTTLQVIYEDGIPVDSIVVFKK